MSAFWGVLECAGYAMVPFVAGWLYNLAFLYCGRAAGAISWIMMLGMLIFWFWAGTRYAKRIKNPILAILAGNAVGILSLAIYLWQEYGVAEKTIWLQALAQNFTTTLVTISARIVVPFCKTVDGVTQVPNTALQIVGLVLFILLFTGGYFRGRQKIALEQTKTGGNEK